MTLNCIPARHRYSNRLCDKPADWYVWYGGCDGGVYTTHCNDHLAESLLDNAVEVVQIDSIKQVEQRVEAYNKRVLKVLERAR